jgi:hypothetical protein
MLAVTMGLLIWPSLRYFVATEKRVILLRLQFLASVTASIGSGLIYLETAPGPKSNANNIILIWFELSVATSVGCLMYIPFETFQILKTRVVGDIMAPWARMSGKYTFVLRTNDEAC